MRIRLLCALLLPWATACAVPAGQAMRDLAAIHTEDDWQPRSPAVMSVPPGAYLGDPVDAAMGSGSYSVEDHRQLELAILDRFRAVAPDQEGETLEASAWLLTELLADDHTAARIRAASILSDYAGHWVARLEVRLPEGTPTGDLEAAVRALHESEDRAEFDAAVAALESAAIPDAWTGVRVLTGLGRTAPAWSTVEDRHEGVFRVALRVVLLGLESGAADDDAEVAEACRVRLQLLRDYGSRPLER